MLRKFIMLAGVALALHALPAFAQWSLVWQDEFEGSALDGSKWSAVNNCGDKRNSEQQCYMASAVAVGNGVLTITGSQQAQSGFSYTSGAVKTGTKFTQAYGRFEFRAQLPAGGQGVWPALWLYPPNQWPPEIDVLEAINSMSTIYMTYHWGTSSTHQSDGGNTTIADPAGWHVYAVEWETSSIRWYIDGALAKTHTGSDVTNIPMQLYINLALGGSWPGSVGVSTVFPQVMHVDYVRVYQRNTEVWQHDRHPRILPRTTFQAAYDLKGRRVSLRALRSAGADAFVVAAEVSEGLMNSRGRLTRFKN
jgi:beta-glucanase (GH16 family)